MMVIFFTFVTPPSPHLKVGESFLSILTFLLGKIFFLKVAENDVRSLKKIYYHFFFYLDPFPNY